MNDVTIKQILNSRRSQVAPGVFIDRPLPQGDIKNWDPFLMLDHFGPAQLSEGKENEISDHPHRGFEPVTFIFSGQATHKDSLGNQATIKSGGVQWITAGSGLIHAEKLTYDEADATRTINGIQLWVNLPIRHKMTEPGYQNLQRDDIPVIHKNGYDVRLVAGEILGIKGPASTYSPIIAAHIIFREHATAAFPLNQEFNTMIHLVKGAGKIGDELVDEKSLALLNKDGDQVEVKAEAGTELLFLSGKPLHEPVASYGPFVMNNMRQIYDAIEDYEQGKMGTINF